MVLEQYTDQNGLGGSNGRIRSDSRRTPANYAVTGGIGCGRRLPLQATDAQPRRGRARPAAAGAGGGRTEACSGRREIVELWRVGEQQLERPEYRALRAKGQRALAKAPAFR